MLAVPCVERSGRQHSAKPTHFVVWPASNTMSTCVNVAATQSCTPCNSLSMSKVVKLRSCSNSLFQHSKCQGPFYQETTCMLQPLSRQPNTLKLCTHSTTVYAVESFQSIITWKFHAMSNDWSKQTAIAAFKDTSCQCPVLDQRDDAETFLKELISKLDSTCIQAYCTSHTMIWMRWQSPWWRWTKRKSEI